MRVLVGTGGSPDAVRAADWLAGFPLPAESQILVVSVLPNLGSRAAEHENAMHVQARQVLEDARLKLAPRAVDVRLIEGASASDFSRPLKSGKPEQKVLSLRTLPSREEKTTQILRRCAWVQFARCAALWRASAKAT
ncbi:MAG: hypothetical protein GEV05_13980 [Betaproteobacteria bacterium]|nr:hypothetical protein [Betaproteobacteria bacterium]